MLKIERLNFRHSVTCCPYLLSFVLHNCLAGEGIAKNKRLKLEYEEHLPSNSSANEIWNKLLTSEEVIDKDDLMDAVKFGTSYFACSSWHRYCAQCRLSPNCV